MKKYYGQGPMVPHNKQLSEGLADTLWFIDKMNKKFGNEFFITGGMITVTCPICFEQNMSINLSKRTGSCGRCQSKLNNILLNYEEMFRANLAEKYKDEDRYARKMKNLMEKPGDIIYKRG